MKILYISDHSILEYDEVRLFTEMGHDVFSLGAYHNLGHEDLPRPAIPGLQFHELLNKIYVDNPVRTHIDERILDWADITVVMHAPQVLASNWFRLAGRKVVWRSIGQSTGSTERMFEGLRDDGLKIVRYSPKEKNIPGFVGEDATIRFYKDPNDWRPWFSDSGGRQVVAFTQALKGRRDFCHYDEIFPTITRFGGVIYGPSNEDLGLYNGGNIPYEKQKQILRESACMLYGGTWPASYTLSFIEAMMTGLPIVAISKKLAHIKKFEAIDFYEVDEIMTKVGMPVCDSVEEMINVTNAITTDRDFAKEISKKERALAIDMFGRDIIAAQWEKVLV